MNTLSTITICFLAFFATANLSAQNPEFNSSLEFKLQLMSDNVTWGVFVRPDETIAPSKKISTGSGQVTLVVPVGFTYGNFTNVSGTWAENARVDGPAEAANKSYVSFGFIVDEPRIKLFPNEETLLFTFVCAPELNNQIALINNENDPFAIDNSYGSNPGNDLGVIDYGQKGGLMYYTYARNYEGNSQVNSYKEILASNNEE